MRKSNVRWKDNGNTFLWTLDPYQALIRNFDASTRRKSHIRNRCKFLKSIKVRNPCRYHQNRLRICWYHSDTIKKRRRCRNRKQVFSCTCDKCLRRIWRTSDSITFRFLYYSKTVSWDFRWCTTPSYFRLRSPIWSYCPLALDPYEKFPECENAIYRSRVTQSSRRI